MEKNTNNRLHISFSGEKYESCIQECFVKKVESSFKYIFKYEGVVAGGAKIKFVAVMFDYEGKVLAKKYVEYGKSFSLREGTESVMIKLYAESFAKGYVILRNLKLIRDCENVKRKVKLAAAAICYVNDERSFEKNLNENLEAIDGAAEENADIIVLGECFYDRLAFEDESSFLALELDGEVVGILKARARKYKMYIAFTSMIKEKNGNISNMGVIIGRDGNICGTYKKNHLTIHEKDMMLEPGNAVGVFDLDFGRVGFAICWDLFFPEYVRELQLNGAEIILNPSAGYKEERTVERACESGAYIITSGMHSVEDARITAPDGSFRAIGSDRKKYVCCEVDLTEEFYIPWLSTSTAATMENVFRYERRPDLYQAGGKL